MVGHVHMDSDDEAMSNASELYVVKSHDLPGGDDYLAIWLVRDGRDALVSCARYILSFEGEAGTNGSASVDDVAFRHTLYDLIALNAPFGGWGPNVLAWTQRAALTTVVKFEDLVEDPLGILRKSPTAAGYQPAEMNT